MSCSYLIPTLKWNQTACFLCLVTLIPSGLLWGNLISYGAKKNHDPDLKWKSKSISGCWQWSLWYHYRWECQRCTKNHDSIPEFFEIDVPKAEEEVRKDTRFLKGFEFKTIHADDSWEFKGYVMTTWRMQNLWMRKAPSPKFIIWRLLLVQVSG